MRLATRRSTSRVVSSSAFLPRALTEAGVRALLAALAVLALVVIVAGVTTLPASALGTWSGPIDPHQNNIYPESPAFVGMSCLSASWCMAVDGSGDVISYNGSTWTDPASHHVDTEVNGNGSDASGISCPTTTFCMVVDQMGYAVEYSGGTWGTPELLVGGGSSNQGQNAIALDAVSCPSATFCVAVDRNGDAMTFDGSSWTSPAFVDDNGTNNDSLESVSCASVTMCVAVDDNGNALSYDGSKWSAPDLIDPPYYTLESVSCPTPSFCVAVDLLGQALTFNGTSWSSPVAVDPDMEPLYAVSCASANFCVTGIASSGGKYDGYVSYFDGTAWTISAAQIDPDNYLQTISCPSMAFCAAGDNYTGGNLFLYTNANTVPGAPTNVIATASKGSADLSWTAPSSAGECPITSYEVDVYSGTTLVSSTATGSTSTTYTVSGLTNGTKYTFTVAATNCDGNGAASAASQPVIPSQPTTPAPYNALTPYRICDTRVGNPSGLSGIDAQCAGKTLSSGGTLTIEVAGTNPSGQSTGGVPSSGATAVVLNVTAADETTGGYLAVYPAGTETPLASNLNFLPGKPVPNLVEVALGTGSSAGEVSVFNDSGSTDVVVDVEGYVGPAPSGAGLYNALTPARICDTRSGNPSQLSGGAAQCNAHGPVTGGTSMDVQVTGLGGVPASGASAVVLNVTVTDTTAAAYLTVWPQGTSRPTASNLNWKPGVSVPNRVVVPLGSTGEISLYVDQGAADVIVDVGGWYSSAGGSGGSLTQFSGITPARIVDTRSGSGEPYEGQALQAGGTLTVQVSGVGGVPANATAVVMNVTVTNTTAGSYLTAWPAGQGRPTASDLNWAANQTLPNLVIVGLGSSGQVSFYNYTGTTDVIADVVGWYQ